MRTDMSKYKDILIFLKNEAKKVSMKKTFGCCVAIIGGYLGWMALLPKIDDWMVEWNNRWLMPLDEGWVVAAIYFILAVGLATYIYAHVKKKAHLSCTTWIFLIFISIIYSYYRCCNWRFNFWGNGTLYWTDVLYGLDIVFLVIEVRYLYFRYKYEERIISKNQNAMLAGDGAIKTETEDIFGYRFIASDLRMLLKDVNTSENAYSVGIAGDWGIGKSSLLNLLSDQLQEDGIVIKFYPRNAKKVELIQEEFFAEFTQELRKYSYNAAYIIGKYAYALNLHSSTRWIYNIIDWFYNWTAESEKEQINKMIQTTEKRFFVVIEDLDRLTGIEILEVLKLIERNGNFCNTIFIAAYDKHYVNAVLRKQLGYGDTSSDFTDKYFQYELPMFRQSTEEIQYYLYKRVYLWAINNYPDVRGKNRPDYEWNTVARKILPMLPTLRHAKRFSNLFRYAYIHHHAYEKVNIPDFIVVTLIRYLDTETYDKLYEQQYVKISNETSNSKQLILAENYEELAKKSKIEGLASLLEYLFDGKFGFRQFEYADYRIDRKEHFLNYFYPEIQGKLYPGEINLALNASTLKDSISMISKYLAEKKKANDSIIEFMDSLNPERVGSAIRLERYTCVLIYLIAHMNSWELRLALMRLLTLNTQQSYVFILTAQQYKNLLLEAFDKMMEYEPYTIGSFIKNHLQERIPLNNKNNELYIESPVEDERIILKALRRYNAQYGTKKWNAEQSILLASWIPGEDKKYYERRCQNAVEMLQKYPDVYAKGLLRIEHFNSSKKIKTEISLAGYNELTSILFFSDGKYDGWVKLIKNANLRYLYTRLHEIAKEENTPICTLKKSIKTNTDYRAMVLAMKEIEKEK